VAVLSAAVTAAHAFIDHLAGEDGTPVPLAPPGRT
jgi:hypothetical protein